MYSNYFALVRTCKHTAWARL